MVVREQLAINFHSKMILLFCDNHPFPYSNRGTEGQVNNETDGQRYFATE